MATGSRLYREVLLNQSSCLRPLLLKALNRNQILILSMVDGSSVTNLLKGLSDEYRIPLSTLKLNVKILRGLGLVTYKESHPAELTETGSLVLQIINRDNR
jgi:hypothetical protein